MTGRGYLLAIADAGGDEQPDRRVLRLLRSLKDFGFALANVQGSDPPSPGMLETIEHEQYTGVGPTAEQLNALSEAEFDALRGQADWY